MVYDILPIQNPLFFPPASQANHNKWLKNIISVADALICISNTVAKDVLSYIQTNQPQKQKNLKVLPLHLGADLPTNISVTDTNADETNLLNSLSDNTTFLMVGTIEPRKGHAQTLESFEMLWKRNIDVNLVIVGKKGWMVDDFIQKLTTHPELNKHLFFLEAISDDLLNKIYASSDALIAASQAEGFGLPLIEAAQHKLPIIARDIPVFHEVASSYAYYFKDTQNPADLFSAIQDWLKLYETKSHPLSDDMPYLLWEQNAKELLSIFTGTL